MEVVGSLTDITQRKAVEEELHKRDEEQKLLIKKLQEAQQQLLQAEKMASIGQLAAGIAHEINNPIGFINSNMNSLQSYVNSLFNVIDRYKNRLSLAELGDDQQKSVNKINTDSELEYIRSDVSDLVSESMDGLNRVKEIVLSLKDFSHVGETEWQEADINNGLESTLNIVKNEIKYKATVEKHYAELPLVSCIISQLNQVFMNLFVNAVQAIKDSGVITIETGTETKDAVPWVWIKVSDTGKGIPPENLNRIFEPFFTTKPVGSGTGLGLSLSYGIITNHKGTISVDSVVGRGTCFTISLPVRQNKP